ncbi:MAG: polysaccharide biosynthesis protein [Candidatus Lambdaproteobacteria bacterium]|nr:polysaccharide biosynthesis protein [Candidatus Lambdaproteobacteria bacterium]
MAHAQRMSRAGRWAAYLHDLTWVVLSVALAYWLRFNLGTIPEPFREGMVVIGGVALAVYGVLFRAFGLYGGIWRVASFPDLTRIVKTVAIGTMATTVILFYLKSLGGVPRSVLLMHPLLLMLGMALPRVGYRRIVERQPHRKRSIGQRTLIVGAGYTAEALLDSLTRHPAFEPVAFIDPDARGRGVPLRGLPVLRGMERVPRIIRDVGIDVVMVALPTIPPPVLEGLAEACAATRVPCRILPTSDELGVGPVDAARLRPVRVEDLLGRAPPALDRTLISGSLRDKRVLVTGGGGFIGSELCRQIAGAGVGRLIVLDNTEANLVQVHTAIRQVYPDVGLHPLLGDIRDRARMKQVFAEHVPQVVFHAAAYKHVELMEANPFEAVENNVIATRALADTADSVGCERFVMISTDKAGHPSNVVGATKRMAELYCQNLQRVSRTRFIATRFGNVIGSSGSVVGIFEQQISEGGPVTVTHPEMTRHFVTALEVAGMVLQTAAMGRGGEVFVVHLGEPVRIADLARKMIRLSGREPGREIQIAYTGLRGGEQLHDRLFLSGDTLVGTDHPHLLEAPSRPIEWKRLLFEIDRIEKSVIERDFSALTASLNFLVPEFTPDPGSPLAQRAVPLGG